MFLRTLFSFFFLVSMCAAYGSELSYDADEELVREEERLMKGEAGAQEPAQEGPSLSDYMNSGVPRVHDAVSILSGAWVDSSYHAVDTSAIDPYRLGHHYSSNSSEEGSLADGWEFFHPSEVEIIVAERVVLYAYESGGAMISFHASSRSSNDFTPQLRGTGYTFISSIASPARCSPHKTRIKWDSKKGQVVMKLGDGRKRTYEQYNSSLENEVYTYRFRLIEEKNSNNITRVYTYDKKSRDLLSITTRLSNGEKVGKVSFEKRGKRCITASLSNGRRVHFNLKSMNDKYDDEKCRVVTSIKPDGGKEIFFHYSENSKKHIRRVEKKKLSDGNTLLAKFYSDGTTIVDGDTYRPKKRDRDFIKSRVKELYAKSLPGEKEPFLSHAFTYKSLGSRFAQAEVKEKDGYTTKYLWNQFSKRIRWVVKRGKDGQRLFLERLTWGVGGEEE